MRQKKWFRIFSPCLLAVLLLALFSLWGIAKAGATQGWSMLAVVSFLPLGFLWIVADILLKRLVKNTLRLWIAELVFIIGSTVLFFQFIR
jgi:hypothetical protein